VEPREFESPPQRLQGAYATITTWPHLYFLRGCFRRISIMGRYSKSTFRIVALSHYGFTYKMLASYEETSRVFLFKTRNRHSILLNEVSTFHIQRRKSLFLLKLEKSSINVGNTEYWIYAFTKLFTTARAGLTCIPIEFRLSYTSAACADGRSRISTHFLIRKTI